MNHNAHRKRRTTLTPRPSRTKSSRTANRHTANVAANAEESVTANIVANVAANVTDNLRGSDSDPTAPTETIHVMDGAEDGVQEVVDLTCEAAETSVVDLTSNDSVLLLDEGPQIRRRSAAQSYIVSSDEDDDFPPVFNTTTPGSANTSRATPGTISCPVCLDSYSEITESGRLVVSTRCGHVFCSQCLRDALRASPCCPSCRKTLTHRQYHPLYV